MAHALVTGANRGLGLEFVRQLLARGERVIATCRQPGRTLALTRLAGEHPGHLTVLPLVLPDARSIAGVAREVEALDVPIGLLVNDAGLMPAGERFGAIGLDDLQAAFAVNAAGPLLLTQALAPSLADGARVVCLSSALGSIARADSLHSPSYRIGKAALNMAVRLLGHALSAQGAVAVALSPGWVRTDMGGANAPLAPADSVAAMLRVIDRLAPADAGAFLSHEGGRIEW